MKYLKMLGIAAMAAMALAAFGVSTASATKLCEENKTASCTKHVGSGAIFTFSAENSTTLTGPFGEVIVTCTGSTFEASITGTGASGIPVTGNISSLAFTGCNRSVTALTATLGSLSIAHIAGTDNGTVSNNDTTITVTGVPFFGTCIFLTNNTDIGKLTGSLGFPTLDIAGTLPSWNKTCPSATWEGSYSYTGGTVFNVAAS